MLSTAFMQMTSLAAVVIGASIGALEAFFEYRLKRPTPWPRLLP